jgi:hypothetical protein
VPTAEHFLPLLYFAGLAAAASLSMTAYTPGRQVPAWW